MHKGAFGFAAAAMTWLAMTASPASASCAAVSPAQLRATVDKLNEQGLDAFRSVSMSQHKTFALSPVLRWYARYLTTSGGGRACSPKQSASLALIHALERVPGRYFGARVTSSKPFRAIAAFGQNARLDESSFASFIEKRPKNQHGFERRSQG